MIARVASAQPPPAPPALASATCSGVIEIGSPLGSILRLERQHDQAAVGCGERDQAALERAPLGRGDEAAQLLAGLEQRLELRPDAVVELGHRPAL